VIIIGDPYIVFEDMAVIKRIEDIKSTKPNTTLIFDFCKNMMKYCMVNNINYAVTVLSIKESIYANSLNAKYILPQKKLLKAIQDIAENYMFDSKILAIIKKENDIENIALKHIDGVIFKNIIK
jgi:hypothetical protein